ncbi:SusC/RagA family TonB-linked outer membrane protein [Hymenobacter sp. B81]|uniref:SusC/RagA family TonB-linked outer membrane protein n=1 Tax=Hymenobacter sp. B81 TaxID=3344878 RepID=UPI0037DD78E4
MRNPYSVARLVLLLGWLLTYQLPGPAVAQTDSGRQTYTLQGRVVDERGQGLPGITVLLGGTTQGTATNADGSYSLAAQVAPGAYTLTFSAVGYRTQSRSITLGSSASVTTDVVLTEARQNLDDVVVIGSTISVSKRELGNAISTVSARELEQAGTGGALNALQGKLAGAQIVQNSGDPSGSMSVRLRGIHSLRGSSDPLYVVDGVIVSNASTNVSQLAPAADNAIGSAANPGQNRLADLNPNDIASINVINGAAAAAQYGSRASNGVVLITTKRGQQGAPRVSVYASFNVNELRKSVPVNTYGKQFGFADLRLYTIGAPTAQQLAANPGVTTTGIVRAGATAQLATNLVDVPRYDYFKEIFQTGYGTDNGASITGGAERTQYLVSVGYLKNEGIIKGTEFTRYNVRARVDQRLTDWAKASVGVAYNNSFSDEKANGNVFYSPINSVNITNNIYDINRRDPSGNLLAVEPTRVNPLSTIEDMKFTQRTNRTISDLQVNLTPFKDLSLDYILGVDTYSQAGQNYIRPYPYQAVAGLPLARFPAGFAANANNNVLQLNSDVNLGYNRQLTEDFRLTLLAGYSYQYFRGELVRTQGQGQAPFISTVSGSASNTVSSNYGLDQFDLSGVFGQATFSFRNLAFVTGALRRDRSSKFSPSETNQYYPKVSGSVVVSDLGFWQNASYLKAFNSLKLRASYGEAGGLTAINSYDRFYQFVPVGFQGRNTFLPSAQLANPRVRPERVAELEVGADLGFLNDRIGLGVSWYEQNTSDLVVDRQIAPSRGGSSIVENVAKLRNEGVEVQLSAVPVKTTNFSWDVTAIFSRNRNKVVDLVGSAAILIDNVAGAPVYLINGQPVGVFYGSAYARNPDGSLLLTPQGFRQDERTIGQSTGALGFTPARGGDGQPSYAQGTSVANVVIGNPNPDWTGSFSTNLTYRRLSLRVLLDAVQGVDVFNADYRTRQGVGLGELAEKELRGELPRGYIFSVYNTQEFRVDDGSFVKLREAALSYTLPPVSRFISNLNVALIGRNLYSWDDYKGFDPETSAGGSSDLLRAVDFGNVPIPRTYQLRLSAAF